MKRIVVVLALMLGSCTALMSHEPITRRVSRPLAPDAMYSRATQALTQMGGTGLHSDRQGGVLSATVHHAVALTVVLTPDGTGTLMTVTGTLLGNKLAIGALTEVDDFVTLEAQL